MKDLMTRWCMPSRGSGAGPPDGWTGPCRSSPPSRPTDSRSRYRVFKAHRWLYHSTPGSRVIKKKKMRAISDPHTVCRSGCATHTWEARGCSRTVRPRPTREGERESAGESVGEKQREGVCVSECVCVCVCEREIVCVCVCVCVCVRERESERERER